MVQLDFGIIHILLLDYSWVIAIYFTFTFFLAYLIDGVITPPYAEAESAKLSTFTLFLVVLSQVAVQGFLAIAAHSLLQNIPSPAHGIQNYSVDSRLGETLRNPAMISVLLFALSKSLQSRLLMLFRRFDSRV